MTTVRKAAPLILGAVALAACVLTVAPVASSAPDALPSAPCYNGIAPFNPYVDNCAIPSRPPHILGAAPDQTAILNCSVGSRVLRAICLSQYVNGGPYPGFAVGGG